jgi:histidinol-phosphate phosphatase family protein
MTSHAAFDAVLFDRDGTLIEDVPYNGDPDLVRPMPHAATVLVALRDRGLRLGVVTNQSAIARGFATRTEVAAVNARVEELLGPIDTWQVCEHDDTADCGCRKPRAGLVLAAAKALGVPPARCLVIGDIGADIAAAQAAGAVGALVPTARTRREEVRSAPIVLPDLAAVLNLVDGVGPPNRPAAEVPVAPDGSRVLAVRADALGDVLLTGPAIRAIAHTADHVTLLCGPSGRGAAELLPGVDDLLEWRVPWLDPDPPEVDPDEIALLVKRIEKARFDRAVIFTSFHQSALPTALLLRLAGVGHISAICEDYPGALLDVRHAVAPDQPEPERALSLARAAGFPLPAVDSGRLRLRGSLPGGPDLVGSQPYIVVHPGTSVPARACPPARCAEFVDALHRDGHRVVVTGAPGEAALTSYVAGRHGTDLGGRTTLKTLAAVMEGADCVIVGNTGPAHLAAAVGTPVVSLFAPTVPYARWGPYGVPAVRLGQTDAPCRDSRARLCPVPSHPCLSTIDPRVVVTAVRELTCGS